MRAPLLFVNTALASGLNELLRRLEDELDLSRQLKVYIAGGMAVHLYTGARVTTDVDAEFSARILVPKELMIEVTLENGKRQVIFLDTNYNSTFGLMHEDYQDDALLVPFEFEHIALYVLSPVDLVVSKIARWAENDREDLSALVSAGLVTAAQIEERALAAQIGFVGGQAMLKLNIRDAVATAREVEAHIR